ncbi:patatin-like phospholipase family protein [Gymnodinialimonas hymeniacidonis]|uniref:patatin-like phospholipase family protein n=1 Tax=Gymnodinialimonas hymeniacidonis TaxID=3126508 RepID=UPI0034C6896E
MPDDLLLIDPPNSTALGQIRFRADAEADVWRHHLSVAHMSARPKILALSSGGEDGAFGAGALVGWTQFGSRPEFDLVTGISAGALIAPFAFAGSAYDRDLEEVFTQFDGDDVLTLRGLRGLLGNSLFNTDGFLALLDIYVTPQLLSAIAERHRSGARLFIVTSNLDQGRAIVWNMGRIAVAGNTTLFRAIMAASSALPGLFPPVTLRYQHGGQTVSETHVDGGLHMQFLAVPEAAFDRSTITDGNGHLYIVINNTIDPRPQAVPRTVLGISQQALTTMVRSSAANGLATAQLFARTSRLTLSYTAVDPDSGIIFDPTERFSQSYMQALFRHGYDRAVSEALWQI